ncbi:2-dehydro-3-deoxygalactonokinase [Phaeobacter sp.]|uniref:2-dehydro-3-deoxygalactonokinase n=1 Tax=Phaeobacter sp. TaxID=1902409 RepID=UPI0025F333B7|nr:2-dehydro-3-deoxygalactonokinase [Phaeobacter sp.]
MSTPTQPKAEIKNAKVTAPELETATETSRETRHGPLAWVAVDWGTSHLRVWLMDRNDTVIKHLSSDQGMSRLQPGDYEPTLLQLLAPYLPDQAEPSEALVPVICCGMAGSRQGWAEAAYTAVPCPPPGLALATQPPLQNSRISVSLLPGVKSVTPPDVMRGEETQIAGFLNAQNASQGTQVVCLPGTHSKWVTIIDGQITAFTTFMTGELFGLLQQQSVLRHCVGTSGWEQSAFEAAIEEAIAAPNSIAASLFRIRATALLSDQTAEAGLARLSGLLIGAELAATQAIWANHPVTILGTDALARCYETALSLKGGTATRVDADALTLAGLRAAHTQLKKAQTP